MKNVMRRVGEVTIATNLDRQILKDGLQTVRLRVQYQGSSRYYTTHMRMSPSEYEKYCKNPPEEHDVTRQFNLFFNAAMHLIQEEDFSFARLLVQVSRSKANSLQGQIQLKIEQLHKENSHNTAIIYNDLLTAINGFLKGKEIPIGRVNQDTCLMFMEYLAKERKNGSTTISIRMRNLSAIMEDAIKYKLIKKNPVKSVKIPRSNKRNLNIHNHTLYKLLTATREEVGDENYKWLNYWRAQYYGNGMNVTDLLRMKRSNFINGELVFVRKKTFHSSGMTVHVPYTPELNDAFNQIAGGHDYILPDLDGIEPGSKAEVLKIKDVAKKINQHIRSIYEILEIRDKKTITYTARHTFATQLIRNGVPIEYISNAMGHTNIRTTQDYFDGYTPEQRKITARYLNIAERLINKE